MNLFTATKEQILTEILIYGDQYNGLNYDELVDMSEDELKEKVKKWIVEAPEA